jgi:hypothetical protein
MMLLVLYNAGNTAVPMGIGVCHLAVAYIETHHRFGNSKFCLNNRRWGACPGWASIQQLSWQLVAKDVRAAIQASFLARWLQRDNVCCVVWCALV